MYFYLETRQSTSKHTASESPVPLAVYNITGQGITSKSELFMLQDTSFCFCFLIYKDVES